MSLDDLSDSQREEMHALITASNNTINRNNAVHRHNGSTTVPVDSIKEHTLTPEEQKALRRVRLNRIIMRKRHHERSGKDIVPRIVTAIVVAFILFTGLISGSTGASYAYYQAQLPLLNGIAQHSLFQTTHIYDRNGKLLYELYDHQQDKGRRTYVNYNDIAKSLVNATVAAENRTFWTDNGVDLQGITRAAFSNVQSQGVVEGGSTITQQLIKKQFFDGQPRDIPTKAEEAVLATGLTQQYPKWQIMEMYLNTIYYGDLNYGVEAAAQDYYGLKPQCSHTQCKPAVAQLDLAQASMLAGLPQGPSLYNPILNKPVAIKRQNIVLQSMVEMGVITKQQMAQAQQETAKYNFTYHSVNSTPQAPHFVRYVIDQVLVPLLGAQNLEDGGYNIYTTIDLDLEKKVEQTVYNHLYTPVNEPYIGDGVVLSQSNNVNNGAAVVMNPYNGEILAMDGSAKYEQNTPEMQGQFNAAISPRQPGSSFKPVVYSTDFEMGWYPGMIVPDHKTTYPGNLQPPYYQPPNYDGTFHNSVPMTIRTAVGNSFNIPAVDGFMYAGASNVQNMAGRLGMTEVTNTKLANFGPASALGSTEVSLLDMTGAYATFANKGVHIPPTSILEITDNQGQPIYKYDEAHPNGTRAMREEVAFMVSSILSDKKARYIEFTPGNTLELDRPAAAKTGTTDKFRDNWTMGYTPHLAVGVWAGNSDNSKMNNVIGITGAGPIWHDIMEYASQRYNFPADDFAKPADVHEGTVSAITGLLPRPGEPTVTDWFIDGTMPTIMSDYTPGNRCNRGQRNCQPQQSTCQGFFCPPIIPTNPIIPGGPPIQ